MRYTIFVGLCLGMACLAVAGEAPRGGRIAWEQDLDRVLRQAAELDRPAMLYFTADW